MATPTITVSNDGHSYSGVIGVSYSGVNGADGSSVNGAVMLSVDDRTKLKVASIIERLVKETILLDIARKQSAWLPTLAQQMAGAIAWDVTHV